MSTITVFMLGHSRGDLVEGLLNSTATVRDLHDVLAKAGIDVDGETHVFLGDAEEPVSKNLADPLDHLKDGLRIHVTRCRRVATTVNYLEHSDEHRFAPGARVRAVKEWAVRKFKINPKDAAEHVLQLCNSTKRPSSDTTLQELTDNNTCAVCFDLVPEKRVEG
ncbi:hypothetical protein FHT72_006811 [Rhizobium sp. BK077]|uniref:hypothetical protein n=1 Tax=Rhizobium TaxID=379 RepID=UPI00117B81C2|nr:MULTISPECIES: hypothetical protein [Rhizobium]MBB3302858.1 hypothetical protein [Rhizobium sp. BK112]MBB3372275.1 hypothetical protein [Rhizobium sp. BK077]MBB4182718.1 hypothetical protein [Rhizobium sp. BK109]